MAVLEIGPKFWISDKVLTLLEDLLTTLGMMFEGTVGMEDTNIDGFQVYFDYRHSE